MQRIEFFIHDLTPEAQKRLIEFCGGDNGNYDVIPFCTIENFDECDEERNAE